MKIWWWNGVLTVVAVGVLTIGGATPSAAQLAGQPKNVSAAPDTIRLDDSIRMATVTLTNPADTATDIWLKPFFSKQQPITMGGFTFGGEQVVDAGGRALDSAWLARFPSAVPWLSDFPQHIVLQPHEQRALPIRVVPYPTLPEGDYHAQFLWIQSPRFKVTQNNGIMDSNYAMPHGSFDVTYHQGSPGTSPLTASGVPHFEMASVLHTPEVLVLDDRAPSTTFTLTNPTDHAVALWLAVDFPDVQEFNDLLFGPGQEGTFFGRTVENAWHNAVPDAELWLSGFPQHLLLQPHERRTLSLQIMPYPTLPDGQYYARLRYVQSPQPPTPPSGAVSIGIPRGALDVVYTKGPALPPVALTAPTLTPDGHGAIRACVTVRQAGVGFVGTLHAAVHDTMGHAVEVRENSGDRLHLWEVTERVVSTERILGNDLAKPICVTLPSVAPGRYVVLLEVIRLDDRRQRHPARLTIPWMVPTLPQPGQ